MILITGATGGLGSEAARHFRTFYPNLPVAGLARDAAKAETLREIGVEVRIGDYTDPESLKAAFEGVTRLFFISSSDVVNRLAHHEYVVAAAKEAGIKHVIYTSFTYAPDGNTVLGTLGETHISTEKMLNDAGIPNTILKNNLYQDVLPMFLGNNVAEQGSIFLPAGNGKGAYVHRSDLAEASARLLGEDGHEGKVYNFSTPESWSFDDIAAMLTEITGKEIVYANPDPDSFETAMRGYGVPEAAIGMTMLFANAIAKNEFDQPSEDLRHFLQREPLSVKTFLTRIYGA